MSYQPGIPTGSVPLNQDYLNIQNNFGQLNTQFNVDHVPLTSTSGNPPNGYHTAIHLVPQVEPVTVSNIGEVWTTIANDGYSNDTIFFQKTGGGLKTQLSRNFLPVAAANGYTFIPGGLVMQWGIVAGSSATNIPVLFATLNKNFTNACFYVTAIPVRASSSPGSDFATCIVNGSVSNLGFTIGNIGGHSVTNWYWMAIGN